MSDSSLASKSREELLQILKQETDLEEKLRAVYQLRKLPVTMELIQDFLEILRQPYPSEILQQALAFINDIAPLKQYPSAKFEILDTLSYLSKNSEENIQKICQRTIRNFQGSAGSAGSVEREGTSLLKIVLLILAIIGGIVVLLVSACFFFVVVNSH